MAVYKVPQDVEAEDKLVGPFGFRQFVYLMIAGFSIFIGYLLFGIYPFLAMLPAPIVGFFVILALPLRKDQPMEIYLLALLRFYLKPKRRLWDPDGTITYVEIVAPKIADELPTKGFTQDVAEQRLDYLARVMDSRGWAVKGVANASSNSSVSDTVAAETYGITDMMDDHATVARSFDALLAQKTEQNRQNAVQRMRGQQPGMQPEQQATPAQARQAFAKNPYDDVLQRQFAGNSQTAQQTATPSPQGTGYTTIQNNIGDSPTQQPPQSFTNAPATSAPATSQTAATPAEDQPHYNPYPNAIHQKVIDPYAIPVVPSIPTTDQPEEHHKIPSNFERIKNHAAHFNSVNGDQKPMAQTVSPDIIRLASNTDLSISAIANEAKRLNEDQDGEVFIKLR